MPIFPKIDSGQEGAHNLDRWCTAVLKVLSSQKLWKWTQSHKETMTLALLKSTVVRSIPIIWFFQIKDSNNPPKVKGFFKPILTVFHLLAQFKKKKYPWHRSAALQHTSHVKKVPLCSNPPMYLKLTTALWWVQKSNNL